MHIKWKKIIITALDIVLAIYLIMAVTSWNKPDESKTAMYQSEYQHI